MSHYTLTQDSITPIRPFPFIISNNQEVEAGFRENKTDLQASIEQHKQAFFAHGGKVTSVPTGIGHGYNTAPLTMAELRNKQYRRAQLAR